MLSAVVVHFLSPYSSLLLLHVLEHFQSSLLENESTNGFSECFLDSSDESGEKGVEGTFEFLKSVFKDIVLVLKEVVFDFLLEELNFFLVRKLIIVIGDDGFEF